jgi:hypothetical protein
MEKDKKQEQLSFFRPNSNLNLYNSSRFGGFDFEYPGFLEVLNSSENDNYIELATVRLTPDEKKYPPRIFAEISINDGLYEGKYSSTEQIYNDLCKGIKDSYVKNCKLSRINNLYFVVIYEESSEVINGEERTKTQTKYIYTDKLRNLVIESNRLKHVLSGEDGLILNLIVGTVHFSS